MVTGPSITVLDRGGGRMLVWDPAAPGTGPVELLRYQAQAGAMAVLPDGRVVTGSDDDQVRLRNVQTSSPGTLLACSAYALATPHSPSGTRLFIGHVGGGISCWEIRPAAQNTPGALADSQGNAAEAREWFQRAAEAGNTNAMVGLGPLAYGPGNVAEAREWFQRAAEAGDTNAMGNLGVLLAEQLDPPELAEAREWFRQAAEAGNTNV